LLGDCERGEKRDGEPGNSTGRVCHEVIMDFSHLDAFDSWGTCRVALRVA
jgi:hypothetical protein